MEKEIGSTVSAWENGTFRKEKTGRMTQKGEKSSAKCVRNAWAWKKPGGGSCLFEGCTV